jgi:hypothetical protein
MWFFDTNCISEMVRLWNEGQDISVREFVADRDVLLTSAVVQELRKAPDILRSLEQALGGANLLLMPDMTRFWYADILGFKNRNHRIAVDALQVQPIPPGFFEMALQRTDFEEACVEAEADVQNRFFGAIELDVGSNLDERDLCIFVFSVVNKYGQEWFQINIQPEDCTPTNFPSFYSFYYAYYFRYAKNQVRPETNDFIDLANCLALPYCERFYGERKFTTLLRDYVQGRVPPTAYQLAKRLHKNGAIGGSAFRVIKRNKAKFSRTSPLLPNTEIFSFAEMRTQIQATAS